MSSNKSVLLSEEPFISEKKSYLRKCPCKRGWQAILLIVTYSSLLVHKLKVENCGCHSELVTGAGTSFTTHTWEALQSCLGKIFAMLHDCKRTNSNLQDFISERSENLWPALFNLSLLWYLKGSRICFGLGAFLTPAFLGTSYKFSGCTTASPSCVFAAECVPKQCAWAELSFSEVNEVSFPQYGKDMDLLEWSRAGLQKWSEGWSISFPRKGWEVWDCSVWKLGGSEKAF